MHIVHSRRNERTGKRNEEYRYMSVLCKKLGGQGKEMRFKKRKTVWFLHSGHKSDKHEFGTGFYISKHSMDNLIDFEPVNEIICKIRVKVKYDNLTLISTHAPSEEKDEVAKAEFYSSLERVCDTVTNYKLKTLLGGLEH